MKGNGTIDVLAKIPGDTIAVEVETGKSKVKTNLNKTGKAGFGCKDGNKIYTRSYG